MGTKANIAFQGRVVLPGDLNGEAVVTRTGFNTLASFYKALLSGSKRAVCSDQDNAELFGKDLKDKIICLPMSLGSTSAGATWDRVAHRGIAPKALLFSRTIDSLTAAGLIIACFWAGKRVVAVDRLGQRFLDEVRDGDSISIREDGTVLLERVTKAKPRRPASKRTPTRRQT
jgi:predicted aconitase with swiveling domain